MLAEVIVIGDPQDIDGDLYTLVGIRKDLFSQLDTVADQLAEDLNAELKCEGSHLLQIKDYDGVSPRSYDANYYLALFIQMWG